MCEGRALLPAGTVCLALVEPLAAAGLVLGRRGNVDEAGLEAGSAGTRKAPGSQFLKEHLALPSNNLSHCRRKKQYKKSLPVPHSHADETMCSAWACESPPPLHSHPISGLSQ